MAEVEQEGRERTVEIEAHRAIVRGLHADQAGLNCAAVRVAPVPLARVRERHIGRGHRPPVDRLAIFPDRVALDREDVRRVVRLLVGFRQPQFGLEVDRGLPRVVGELGQHRVAVVVVQEGLVAERQETVERGQVGSVGNAQLATDRRRVAAGLCGDGLLLFGLRLRVGGLVGRLLLLFNLRRGPGRRGLGVVVIVVAAADQRQRGGADAGLGRSSQHRAPRQPPRPHSRPVVCRRHEMPP